MVKKLISQGKKSVTGFSRLQYVLAIIAKTFEKPTFTFDEAYTEVKKTALSIEAERRLKTKTRIDVSRLGYGYLLDEKLLEGYGKTKLQTITRMAISGMKKWKLIEPIGSNQFRPLHDELGGYKFIGKFYLEGNIKAAKNVLYQYLIQYEEPFKVSRFILPLRDYKGGKIIFKKPRYVEKVWHGTGGVAYTDNGFIKYLRTNPWSITIMSDWGKFFQLTEWFNDALNLDGVKCNCRLLLLTKRVSSVTELKEIYDFMASRKIEKKEVLLHDFQKKKSLTLYGAKSILSCALKVGLFKIYNGKVICHERMLKDKELIKRSLQRGALVVLESQSTSRVIFDAEHIYSVNGADIYLLFDEKIDENTFYDALYDSYVKAVEGKIYESALIDDVRKITCQSLMINRQAFDTLLRDLCVKVGPPYIELSKASIREKFLDLTSFKYFDNTYHMIKVRKK